MAPNAPAAKSSNRGCWIAVAVAVGVLTIAGAGVGWGVYTVMTSPPAKTLIGVFSEGAAAIEQAQKAPGTAAMRAAGCDQALVVDGDDVLKIISKLDPDAGLPKPGAGGLLALCTASDAKKAPTCDAIARTYVRSVRVAKGPFEVRVDSDGNTLCTESYTARGARTSGAAPMRAPGGASE